MASELSLFNLNDQYRYLKNPKSVGCLPLDQVSCLESRKLVAHNLIPVTVIDWHTSQRFHHNLDSVYASFAGRDDVWSPVFLELIVLKTPNLSDIDIEPSDILYVTTSGFHLPEGPHLIDQQTGEIFPVYRLYPDNNQAFAAGCLPTSSGPKSFSNLPRECQGLIAVPSRLYNEASVTYPLAGLRFAVKDAISLKGLRTSYGNKAYYNIFAEAEETAPAIQMLLDAGAVMVGQVKTSEFGEGVDPIEWIDYICPFNPRGDGHQKPSSSSTGSAVAAAAYDWLDFTIGSDTGGSIRHPAGVNGLFGNRPTHGAISLDGTLGATDILNTVGIFARDPSTFATVGSCLLPLTYQPHVPRSERKYKLLYPVRGQGDSTSHIRWFSDPAQTQPFERLSPAEKHMEAFITNLEHYLGASRQPFNIDSLWRATRPKGQLPNLDDAVGSVYSTLTSYFASRDLLPFLRPGSGTDKDTQSSSPSSLATQAKYAISSPTVHTRLTHGLHLTHSHITRALAAKHAFTQWFLSVLMGSLEEEEISILVFPQSFGMPNPRDGEPAFGVGSGKGKKHMPGEGGGGGGKEGGKNRGLFDNRFSIYAFGYLVGAPDYTVPVGEVAFPPSTPPSTPTPTPTSTPTSTPNPPPTLSEAGDEAEKEKQEPRLPVSVSMVARPGNDIVLFDVLRGMEERGMVRGVRTGGRMYAD